MKLIAFNVSPDEEPYFAKFTEESGWDVTLVSEHLTPETVPMAYGFENVSLGGGKTYYGEDLLQDLYDHGTRFVVARSIGFDYIDIAAADRIGLRVSNISYSPFSVAEYALLLILMCQRHLGTILDRIGRRDYTIENTMGNELWDCTVGVVGAGRIGRALMKLLSGFGCRVLTYDKFRPDALPDYVTFTDLDTLLRESDIISVHIPSNAETVGLFNKETFAKMKDGAVFVTTARGDITVTEDLVKALESGKLAAAGLDVLAEEETFFRRDNEGRPDPNENVTKLEKMTNVFLTPHIAFNTYQALREVVQHTFDSFRLFQSGEDNPWELTGRGSSL